MLCRCFCCIENYVGDYLFVVVSGVSGMLWIIFNIFLLIFDDGGVMLVLILRWKECLVCFLVKKRLYVVIEISNSFVSVY